MSKKNFARSCEFSQLVQDLQLGGVAVDQGDPTLAV